jgi:hypothetical protein
MAMIEPTSLHTLTHTHSHTRTQTLTHSVTHTHNRKQEPVVRKMPRVPDAYGPPTCMAIMEPSKTASKGIEVLLAVDKTVLVVDLTGMILSYVLSLEWLHAAIPSSHRVFFFYFWAQYGRIQDFFFQNLVKWTQNVGEDMRVNFQYILLCVNLNLCIYVCTSVLS